MTIRLDDELKNRLDALANATHRTKSFLASEAISRYVDLNEWQIDEIQKAIKEADAGDFADTQEVNNIFEKWGVSGS